jgi:hypothetical protein
MTRAWPILLLALGACASADTFVTPPPPSFREIRSLVLVRMAGDRAGRQKDPLDGLEESLRAHGYKTRVVELSGKRSEQPALTRLFEDLELRAGAAQGERFGTKPYSTLGRGAADTVAALGVDAVASYHRLEGRSSLPRSETTTLPGTVLPGPPVETPRGPRGAIALVDRAGHVATFAWGETTALEDPEVPVNAAEAIDLVVRALSGEPAREPE